MGGRGPSPQIPAHLGQSTQCQAFIALLKPALTWIKTLRMMGRPWRHPGPGPGPAMVCAQQVPGPQFPPLSSKGSAPLSVHMITFLNWFLLCRLQRPWQLNCHPAPWPSLSRPRPGPWSMSRARQPRYAPKYGTTAASQGGTAPPHPFYSIRREAINTGRSRAGGGSEPQGSLRAHRVPAVAWHRSPGPRSPSPGDPRLSRESS